MCKMTPDEDGIPFVTRTATNNGVGGIVEPVEGVTPYPAGSLSIALGGSIGSTFLQTKEFYTSQNVAVLQPKTNLDSGILLFLARLIEKECSKRFVAFGRELNKHIKRDFTIKLPLIEKDKPNWPIIASIVKDQIIPQLPKKAQKVWLHKYDTTSQKHEDMKLNIQDWKYYTIGDLFRVELTKGDIKADEVDSGDIPLISSGGGNNGVVKYISKEGDGKAEMFPDNTITLDMFCHANYQGIPYYAVGHGRVNILFPKFDLNRYIGIFICTLINREVYRFSYGRAVYSTVAEKMKIKLPTAPSGTPDWQFMEDYIKSLPFSKNIEPSKPNEVVDELVEMKKEMIKMRRAMEAQQQTSITNYGTVNIYEK